MITDEDRKRIESTLICLERLLKGGEKLGLNSQNLILKRIYHSNLANWLEDLQWHKLKKINRLSTNILNKYFEIGYFLV